MVKGLNINENSKMSCDVEVLNGFVIWGTLFPHKKSLKVTW